MSVVSKFENSRCYIQLKKEQVYKKKKTFLRNSWCSEKDIGAQEI